MNLARLLFERIHHADVGDGAVADARDAKLCQLIIGWHAVHDHDVDRQRDAVTNPTDQRSVFQAGDEEPRGARSGVCFAPVESLADRLAGSPSIEHVRPSVDEERNAFALCCGADGSDPTRLAVDPVKALALDDQILKVDADHAEIDQSRDACTARPLPSLRTIRARRPS